MYVPLRVHGHHSLLTGVDPPHALVARAAGLGLPAMALADVNCLTGLVDFLRASEGTADVRPLVAAEIADAGGRAGRLVALVETEQGYRNLCRLVSARQLGRDLGVEDPDEEFDLIQYAAGHQAGLFFLADHPRLLLGLHGRVPAERLFAAISPAALRLGGSARRARGPPRHPPPPPAAPPGGGGRAQHPPRAGGRGGRERDARSANRG